MKLAKVRYRFIALAIIASLIAAPTVHAFNGAAPESSAATVLLWLVIILLVAKVAGLVERIGQPPVLGELLAGVVLGNLTLLGVQWFEPMKSDPRINFLAQVGVVILLFQVGLETSINDMRKVGARAFLVACVGVAVPFFLATVLAGPLLLPGLSTNAYLFLGATLTATSVGITARVFRDLGALNSREAQIVLGAAVIDDVLGLMILAVVSAIATVGTTNLELVVLITLKALVFLAATLVFGQLLAPKVSEMFSRIQPGLGMKFTLAVSFGLVTAYLAEQIGLAPIVGAFAAGLVLDPVHFRHFEEARMIADLRKSIADTDPEIQARLTPIIREYADRHVADLLEPLGHFLVPVFFVMTGVGVRLETFFNLPILLVALGITVVAFAGKVVSGLVAGNVRKSIVGWGMVPRGEVGLIFAASGRSLGIVSNEIFSMLVIVIILSTLLTPPILTFIIRHQGVKSPVPTPTIESFPSVITER